jgi:hypothetical protein
MCFSCNSELLGFLVSFLFIYLFSQCWDGTQGHAHARQLLYHRATSSLEVPTFLEPGFLSVVPLAVITGVWEQILTAYNRG